MSEGQRFIGGTQSFSPGVAPRTLLDAGLGNGAEIGKVIVLQEMEVRRLYQ